MHAASESECASDRAVFCACITYVCTGLRAPGCIASLGQMKAQYVHAHWIEQREMRPILKPRTFHGRFRRLPSRVYAQHSSRRQTPRLARRLPMLSAIGRKCASVSEGSIAGRKHEAIPFVQVQPGTGDRGFGNQ